MVLCCSVTTAAVPVHVHTSPPIAVLSEENFISVLNKANAIVNRVTDTPAVVQLMIQLKEDLSQYNRTAIQDQLKQQFEDALYQGGIPPGNVPQLALFVAYSKVKDIRTMVAMHGD